MTFRQLLLHRRLLEHNKNAFGTYCYLPMLRFVTIAYIDKTTNILQRIFHAWSVAFIFRLWFEWIRYKFVIQIRKRTDQNRMPPYKIIEHHSMTFPTLHSIEVNAHVNFHCNISFEPKIAG